VLGADSMTCHVKQHPMSEWGCWTDHTEQKRAGNNSSPLYHAALSINKCIWRPHPTILQRSLLKSQGGWKVSSTEITA